MISVLTGMGSGVRIPLGSSFKRSSNQVVSRVWAFSLFSDRTEPDYRCMFIHCSKTAPKAYFSLSYGNFQRV